MAKRIASTFSILVILCAFAHAVDYAKLKSDFDSAVGPSNKMQVLVEAQTKDKNLVRNDRGLDTLISDYEQDDGDESDAKDIDSALALRAEAQQALTQSSSSSVEANIKQIKSSALYHDQKLRQSNWIETAVKHFSDLFHFRQENHPMQPPQVRPGRFIIYGLIALIAIAILFFAFLFARQFEYRKTLKRKASSLLEDDEPERTADEWLELADGLAAQERFREAVRCLYLACLLRLDEADVARFRREETNWEHLARIESSPKLPSGFEFRSATRAFDLVWYGHQIKGQEDVTKFKAWYSDLLLHVRTPAA